MKQLQTALLVLSFLVAASAWAEKPASKEKESDKGHPSQDPGRVFYNLKGKFEWRLGAETITISVDDENINFVSKAGTVVYQITAPRHLEGIVVSKNAKYLLLLTTRSDRRSPFYDSLVRLAFSEEGRLEAKELLSGDQPGFNDSGRWVQQVGAISDDGRYVLALLSRPLDRGAGRTSYFYDWELWDTQEPGMLRRGLQISDVNQVGADQPAAVVERKPEGNEKTKLEADERSR